jgi:hypothetical protein
MYLAFTLMLMLLVFLALCVIGLFALIRQAVVEPPFAAPHIFIEDPASPASSKDAEGSACGERCA